MPPDQPRNSADRGQHEHRDLPVGFLLVFGVVRPGLDGALPPHRLLAAEHLASVVFAGGAAVLQLDPRGFLTTLWYQTGCLGAPPREATIAYSPSCSTRISGVLRSLPVLAPTVVSTMMGFPFMSVASVPPDCSYFSACSRAQFHGRDRREFRISEASD